VFLKVLILAFTFHNVRYPLNSLISFLSLNHPLYADDVKLFSFHPHHFDSKIAHLQNALEHISSWMAANLLIPNSSKTEFFLTGSNNNLSEFTTPHTVRYFGFLYFAEHLNLSDQISSLSKSCYSCIRELRSIQLSLP